MKYAVATWWQQLSGRMERNLAVRYYTNAVLCENKMQHMICKQTKMDKGEAQRETLDLLSSSYCVREDSLKFLML